MVHSLPSSSGTDCKVAPASSPHPVSIPVALCLFSPSPPNSELSRVICFGSMGCCKWDTNVSLRDTGTWDYLALVPSPSLREDACAGLLEDKRHMEESPVSMVVSAEATLDCLIVDPQTCGQTQSK